MRTLNKLSLLFFLLPVLTACPVQNRPRVEHEGRRDWSPAQTPVDNTVENNSFNDFKLKAAYDALKDGKGNLIHRVLQPLSKYVLNENFIERAEFRTLRMKQMIEVFNSALLERLTAKDTSPEFREIKDAFYQTVFAGCSRDLKTDCANAELFTQDTRHTRIMTLMAMELDAPIEAAVKTATSTLKCVKNDSKCRALVEDRYRLLAMALYKRNRYDDPDYAFAYMKHARIFAELIEIWRTPNPSKFPNVVENRDGNMVTSYLAETHAKIFETIIPKYKPRDKNDAEFRQFVENFNPWGFSKKRADIFQYGTGIMFNFAANCCMYKDKDKKQISDAMESTIRAEQSNSDLINPTLYKMVEEIEKEKQEKLFDYLHIRADVALVKQIAKPNLAFYNEYFFVVDRLFRGDLSNNEVEMVLRNSDQVRLQAALPSIIATYIRINMAYMVMYTNRFMRDEIYKEVASDKVFEKALTRSRELTSRWHNMQAQIAQLERLMGSYFKSHFLITKESKNYLATEKLIKSVNRNIHYLSVYPQMMVLNFYLASMDGKLSFDTWWGRVEIESGKIIGDFFDGIQPKSPWFRFGTDPELINRQMLLFSFEYLLSTESLSFFVANGKTRAHFFDTIISKYFDVELTQLNTFISDYEREIYSQENSATVEEMCRYERGDANARAPNVELDFLSLNQFTYSGMGDKGTRRSLMKILTGTNSSTTALRGRIESRALYIRVMLDIINADLRRRGVSDKDLEDHPDTRRIREGLATMEKMKVRLAKLFLANHQQYFDCAYTLDQVERRRANRLYEEERQHLLSIYKMMEPLKAIPDGEELKKASAELTQKLRASGYRFDLIDGRTYKMSKFDLYMRIKKNIEGDIFRTPTDNEKQVYGADVNTYNRPRSVRVNVPANVERNDITGAETSIQVILRSTDEDFVAQGMSAFNSKPGSFIDWSAQRQNDPQLDQALPPMIEFYLIGPVVDGRRTMEIKKEDLTKAFIRLLSRNAMDDFDIRYADYFGDEGVQKKSYFEGKLFERDFRTRLPLFYDLARKVSGSAELTFDGDYKLSETLNFARIFNTLQPFVFEPDQIAVPPGNSAETEPKYRVRESVREIYGQRMHYLFNRVNDLFRHMDAEQARAETAPNSKVFNPGKLNKGLLRPFYRENGVNVVWYRDDLRNANNLIVDEQKKSDVENILEDFISRSGDFYKSSKAVKGLKTP